ncbi:MAG: ABC transporter ATP-binding protein [Candidatus Edwardsbacteria bacterium]|jgi:putative ABC transport system ATP-binding protein|nr:ABC transporter ATP-binding protein [Candidatus Edwardsbacteria bacterium]
MVQAKGITKTYNKGSGASVQALREVNLEIQQGEFVAIMGASGSGKSTLMNILGCLDKPSGGQLLLDGQEVSQMDDQALAKVRNQKIGFVFQSFNLMPRANALENVELPLIYSDKADITRLSREALESVGLKDRIHHNPGELSGGQQQRVAIARAIVNQPEIIFADEPTGNLDTRSSYEIIALFQQLNQQGKTVVLVTHEPDIAEYAKRIIKITDGSIVSDQANASPKDAALALDQIPKQEVRNENK